MLDPRRIERYVDEVEKIESFQDDDRKMMIEYDVSNNAVGSKLSRSQTHF